MAGKRVSDAEIKRYFDKYEKAGYSEKALEEFLASRGVSMAQIVAALKGKDTVKHGFSLPHVSPAFWWGLLVIVCVVIIITFLLLLEKTKDCADDKECFFELANNCEAARFVQDFENSTVEYTTNGCAVVKRITAFAEDEPPEVRDLFNRKTMICNFEKGNLDRAVVDGLLLGIEACEGDLKDAIYDLRIAQLAIG